MQKLNNQQLLFLLCKKKLEYYKEVEKTRPLKFSEKREIDEMKQAMLESVMRFGIKRMHERLAKYRKDSDAFQDIQQELALIFYDKLDSYDPRRSTPTTYFVRYFDEAITNYVLNFSQHMTQYDANNVAAVRAAIKEYEGRGIDWDIAMLATHTRLSQKVVTNTLRIANNSIRGSVDDMVGIAANQPTPEEAYIQNERTNVIYNVLHESLSPEELTFLMHKLNFDGKERSITQVAEDLDMPVRDAKKMWSSIIARLNNNRSLQTYGHAKKSGSGARVALQKNKASSAGGNMFLSALGGVKLHNDEVDNSTPFNSAD